MSDTIKILLEAGIDPKSVSKINEDIKNIAKNIEGLKIKVETDGLKNVKQDIDRVRRDVASTKGAKVNIVDSEALKNSGRDFAIAGKSIQNTVKDIENSYRKLGKVSTERMKIDPMTGAVESFAIRLEQAGGVMRDYQYDLKRLEGEEAAFVNTRITGRDRSSKLEIEGMERANKEKAKIREKELRDSERIEEKRINEMSRMDAAKHKRVEKERKDYQRRLERERKEQEKVERMQQVDVGRLASGMQSTGRTMMAMSAPLIAMGVAGVKASIDFESAFAIVRKTMVGATEGEFAELEKGIISMTKRLPQTAIEISQVAATAGQLGIEKDKITDFSEAMIRLGDASTDLGADEAAAQLAKFANITDMSHGDFDKLGSTVIELGNNLATTESELVHMSLGLAGAGKQVGMTEAQIMSIAAAMSSVGIQSARGGTSMSKLFINMALAAQKGGDSLDDFANASRVSAGEFKRAFEDDAANAFSMFINGLAQSEAEGESVLKILDDMGISEMRLRDTILRTVGANETLNKSLAMGSEAWSQNTALADRSNEIYETTAAQLKILRNEIVDVIRTIGADLSPTILDGANMIGDFVKGFSNLPVEIQSGVVKMGAFVGVTGLLLSLGGRFLRGASGATMMMAELGKMFGGAIVTTDAAGKSLGGFTVLLNTLKSSAGLTSIAVVAALGLIGKAIYKEVQATRKAKEEMEEFVEGFAETKVKKTGELEYLEDIQLEFENLNGLVGKNGDLSDMSTKQQERYLEIVKKISETSPELETYYNSQGQLVADTTTKVKELIEAKKEEMRLDQEKLSAGFDKRMKEHSKNIEDSLKKEKKLKEDINRIEKALQEDEDAPEGKKMGENLKNVFRKKLSEARRDLRETTLDMKRDFDETSKFIEAEMFAIGDSFKVAEPHVDSFSTSLKNMLKDASSEEDMKKISQAIFEIGDMSEDIQKHIDKGMGLSGFSGDKYIQRLIDTGMEQRDAMKNVYGMLSQAQSGDTAFGTMNKAINEFNKNGKITKGTSEELKQSFDGISRNIEGNVEKIDLNLIKSIGTQDSWAAAFLVSSTEVSKNISELEALNKKQLDTLKPRDVARPEDYLSQIETAKKHRDSMNEITEKEAEERIEMVRYLHEDLGRMTKKQADDEIAEIRRAADIRRQSAENSYQEQTLAMSKMGSTIREDMIQAVTSAEQDVRTLGQIWNDLSPETKEFLINTEGIDGANDKFRKFLEMDSTKELTVTFEGMEYVERNMDVLKNDWNRLAPEEKIFAAKVIGEGLEDAKEFQKNWDALDPKAKKYIAEAVGIDGVKNADEATMSQWANNPLVKLFAATHDGLDNVRIEQDKTDNKWNIHIGNRVYRFVEDGAVEVRNQTQRTVDLWNSTPANNIKRFTQIFQTKGDPSGMPAKPKASNNNRSVVFLPGKAPGENWTGDDNFEGGLSYVGERGRELLIYPDSSYDMTGDSTELRNLPKGTKIYNNQDTEDILVGKKIPKFEKGNTKARDAKEQFDIRNATRQRRIDAIEREIANLTARLAVSTNIKTSDGYRSELSQQVRLLEKKQKQQHQNAQDLRKEISSGRIIGEQLSEAKIKIQELSTEWWNAQSAIAGYREEWYKSRQLKHEEIISTIDRELAFSTAKSSTMDKEDEPRKYREELNKQIELLKDKQQKQHEYAQSLRYEINNGHLVGEQLKDAKIKVKELSTEWWGVQNAIKSNREELKQMVEDWKELQRSKWITEQNKLYDEQQKRLSALDSIQEKIVAVIKERGEEEKRILDENHRKMKDNLNEELELFRDMIQGKIDALDEQYSEEDYLEDLKKERDKANKIQSEIDLRSLDNTLEGRNKTIALRKELAEQNEVISKMQQRKERDVLKKSLQDQLKNKEKSVKDENDLADKEYDKSKEILDDKYSNEKLYAEAKRIISEETFVDIFNEFLKFDKKFGKGMGILGDVISKELLDQLELAKLALVDVDEGIDNMRKKYDSDAEPTKEELGFPLDATVEKYTKEYEDAKARNDFEAMERAHRGANVIRGYGDTVTATAQKDIDRAKDRKLEEYRVMYEDARKVHDFEKMEHANRQANIIRGKGDSTTAGIDIERSRRLSEQLKLYEEASKKNDFATMESANKQANFIRGLGHIITAQKDIDRAKIAYYTEMYNNARKSGDWQSMEHANRQANIARGLGDIITSQVDIKSIRGYSTGIEQGLITEDQLAVLHGDRKNWEAVFTKEQLSSLVKGAVASTVNAVPKVSAPTLPQSISLQIDNLINVDGNIDKSSIPDIKRAGNDVASNIISELNRMGTFRTVRI